MKKGFLVAIILIAVLTCAFALVACGEVSTTVTYMVDGEVFKTIVVTGTGQSDPGFTPSKSGYTFGGWYTDTELLTPFDFEAYAANNERGDIVVYGKWEVNTYTATFIFMVGGNIIIEEVRFDADDMYVDEPDVPQRTGYTGEWEDYEIKAEDLMINAVYTPITYNITYENTLGAVNTNPATYNIESAITLSDITSPGYTFEGWFAGEEKVESIELGSYGDITLTAKWAPITYSITYENTKGAANGNPATYNIETATITLADITSPGYTFEGWFAGEEKVESIELGSYGDITLTAKWAVITYTATFVNSDGTVGTVDFDIEDTALSEPAVPQRTGYTGAWEAYEIKAENLTINAVYTPITYNITYENTLGAINTNPATYNIETAITLSDITSPGYTFEGWFAGEEKVESIELGSYGDITLTAKWAVDMSTENYVRVNENNERDEDGGYILFGQYPQTIKAAYVSIISTTPDTDGYYLGSDGERYAKVVADPCNSGYKFSDNSSVTSGNTYYFKVEPIRWRILSESNGKAFILCDSIIANKAYDAGNNNNYANSDIRAWLNDEFYKTAFGDLQQTLIQTTEVDNSAQSAGYWSNPYACENTSDKVFLLSYREVTTIEYGFESSTARRMLTSDFSRATGAYMSYSGYGYWWLRSPFDDYSYIARLVGSDGSANSGSAVDGSYFGGDIVGVVPALNLTLS